MSQHFAWRYPKSEERCLRISNVPSELSRKSVERCVSDRSSHGRNKNEQSLKGLRHTDSSDFNVQKPSDQNAVKHWYTNKNRKYAMRYAIACSLETGDICWVSCGHPRIDIRPKYKSPRGISGRSEIF